MTTRLPYHKDLSVHRSIARANRFAKELGRGQFRGRTPDQLQKIGDFYCLGGHLSDNAEMVDILVSNVVPSSDTQATFDLSLRCRACGGPDVEVPQDNDHLSMCRCRSCGANLGQWGEILKFAQWLTLEEARYGKAGRAEA